MWPTNSGDTAASPGPMGKAKGLGILTMWEAGILGADFRKTCRLTQTCTFSQTVTPTHRTDIHGLTVSHPDCTQPPNSGWSFPV